MAPKSTRETLEEARIRFVNEYRLDGIPLKRACQFVVMEMRRKNPIINELTLAQYQEFLLADRILKRTLDMLKVYFMLEYARFTFGVQPTPRQEKCIRNLTKRLDKLAHIDRLTLIKATRGSQTGTRGQ